MEASGFFHVAVAKEGKEREGEGELKVAGVKRAALLFFCSSFLRSPEGGGKRNKHNDRALLPSSPPSDEIGPERANFAGRGPNGKK